MSRFFPENVPSRRQMAENTVSTVIIRGLVGGGRGVMLIVIARVYGPEEFGKLAVVAATVDILRSVAEFGLGITAIRRFARFENIVRPVVGLNLICGSVAFLLGLTFVGLAYGEHPYLMLMAILGVSLYTQSLIATFQSYFQAHLSMRSILGASVLGGLLYAGATLAAAIGRTSLAVPVLLIPLTEAVVLFLVHRRWRTLVGTGGAEGSDVISRRTLLREAYPVAATSFLVGLYLRGDNLLLSWLGGESVVGTYAACARLFEPLVMTAAAGAMTFHASLSRQQDSGQARSFLRRTYTPLFAAAAAISVLASFVSPWVARTVLPGYPGAENVLSILAWSILLKAIGMNLAAVLYSRGRYGWIAGVISINVITNLSLNILLIPTYGARGSAMAIVASEGLNCILQGLLCRSLLRRRDAST